MKCALCNGSVSIVIGSIPFESKPLGRILIPSVRHSVCRDCGEITFSHEAAEKIDVYIEEKESAAINSLPIGEFIPLNEAAQVLGISKQAFSKHSRIKRGFIYSTMKGNSRLYYKPSVEEFKRTGKDGRLRIAPQPIIIETRKQQIHDKLYIVPSPAASHGRLMYDRQKMLGIAEPNRIFTKCASVLEDVLFAETDSSLLGACFPWHKKENYHVRKVK